MTTGHLQSLMETDFNLGYIYVGLLEQQDGFETIQLSFVPTFPGVVQDCVRFGQCREPFFGLADFSPRPSL